MRQKATDLFNQTMVEVMCLFTSALERAGIATLNEGQKVSYELATNKGKTSAVNIKPL